MTRKPAVDARRQLSGHTATGRSRCTLITGAGRRIGAVMARALADDGWSLALHYNTSRTPAETVVRDVVATGGCAVALPANLDSEREAAALLGAASEALGAPIDLLINNAAAFAPDHGRTGDDRDEAEIWRHHMAVNLRAPLLLSRAFLDQFEVQKDIPDDCLDPSIVNIVDAARDLPPRNFLAYGLSKSGLWSMTQALASEAAPRVRVNALALGATLRHPNQSKRHYDALAGNTLLQRNTKTSEIASAIKFLATTPAITGQVLRLDNGAHLL